MLNKIIDEYKYLKGIVKTDSFCLIDTKKLVTVVIWTKNNNYLRFYDVDLLNFEYFDNTVYIHDTHNGYSEEIDNEIIKKITIL